MITTFVGQEAARRQRAGRKLPAVAVRSFLRFLVFRGAIRPGLEAAAPSPPQWRHASLPSRLTPEEVERVLAVYHDGTASSLRNRAILFLPGASWPPRAGRRLAVLRRYRLGRWALRPAARQVSSGAQLTPATRRRPGYRGLLARRTPSECESPGLSALSAAVSAVDQECGLVDRAASVRPCRPRRPSWHRQPYLPAYGRLPDGQPWCELQRRGRCLGPSIHPDHGYLRQVGPRRLSGGRPALGRRGAMTCRLC